ncbi:unnamed protein product [Prorocentrum cordatum]|uniref:Uncharacterized protein n=1 Tax=Prorocentrum cordatum TaxID=2364126 RepID=A0ABN9WIU7_9DINO|nr:unnamed protein product [Polarella glacialis]
MLEKKRQKLEAIDPECVAIRREQREHKEMQSYREQGQVVAAAMTSTFGAHLQSLQLVHPGGPASPPPPPADGAASGSAAAGHAGRAPEPAAQGAKKTPSRSELGWFRTILGPKHVPEYGFSVGDLSKFVVSKMSDKTLREEGDLEDQRCTRGEAVSSHSRECALICLMRRL